jgi:malate dehydrogenase (quinone)
MSDRDTTYDVVIVGGGASGTALLYVLSRYTDIQRIALVEKYQTLGSVNSNAKNNSQTLHVGDIETNYGIEKVRQVKPAAMMVKRYLDALPSEERDPIIRGVQKMVLGVGASEVASLEKRYAEMRELFPEMQKLDAKGIAEAEPEIMRGRRPDEPVLALFNPKGYAVNYGKLANSLAQNAQKNEKSGGKHIDIALGRSVQNIEKKNGTYVLHTDKGDLEAPAVVFDTDAYSLGFAKSLDYGKEFSLIPVAGSFYFTPQKLRGKVYRVQEKRMPFAAVHGDPDLTMENVTRWGPTARFYPVLEAGKLRTSGAYFASAGIFRPQTWLSFIVILLEPIRFWYLVKNLFYDLPLVGKYFFLPQVRAIVPSVKASDLRWAKGYGGMRLQRVDTNTRELLLGEGKIIGENIIFNMSPSPGASVSLYNAMRDAEQIIKFAPRFTFDKKRMLADLCEPEGPADSGDTSLKESYAS